MENDNLRPFGRTAQGAGLRSGDLGHPAACDTQSFQFLPPLCTSGTSNAERCSDLPKVTLIITRWQNVDVGPDVTPELCLCWGQVFVPGEAPEKEPGGNPGQQKEVLEVLRWKNHPGPRVSWKKHWSLPLGWGDRHHAK